jgi:hypothetical protein
VFHCSDSRHHMKSKQLAHSEPLARIVKVGTRVSGQA